jgi:sulfur carrier protein
MTHADDPTKPTGTMDATRTDPAPATITVTVNGEPRALPASVALAEVVAAMTVAPSGVAAALNETVVPRGRWAGTSLADGDRVEILTAVQGG